MPEPRMIQGVPRISERSREVGAGGRKALPGGLGQQAGLRERMNGLALNRPDGVLSVAQQPPPESPPPVLSGGRRGGWLIG